MGLNMKYFLVLFGFISSFSWLYSGFISTSAIGKMTLFSLNPLLLTSNWILPIIVVLTFVHFSKLKTRIEYNWGTTLLIFTAIFALFPSFMLLLKNMSSIFGLVYITGMFSPFLYPVIKFLFIVSSVKVLISTNKI
jgi:hypothetical protein